MRCRQFEQRMVAYRDGQLDAGQLEEVEGHLGACLRCRRALHGLERVSEVLAAIPHFSPSPSVQPDVRVAAPRPLQSRPFPAALALVLAVSMFVSARFLMPSSDPAPDVASGGATLACRVEVGGHTYSVMTEGDDMELLEVQFSTPNGPGFSVSYRQ